MKPHHQPSESKEHNAARFRPQSVFYFLSCLHLFLWISGCCTYDHKHLQFHVQDAETNQPLGGVTVKRKYLKAAGIAGVKVLEDGIELTGPDGSATFDHVIPKHRFTLTMNGYFPINVTMNYKVCEFSWTSGIESYAVKRGFSNDGHIYIQMSSVPLNE